MSGFAAAAGAGAGADAVGAGAAARAGLAAAAAASGLEAAERFVRDVEIGEEPLDVVMILEQFHELQG